MGAGVRFPGTNGIMLMPEWMSTLFHLSCFYSSGSASYKGGSDGVPRWGQLTNLLATPTVSTWDQFIPNRAWTLINLSPPTALKIQFKGPVTDQNELAFFPRPQWLTCSELAVWSCSSWICQFVCVPALPFHLSAAAFSCQKLSWFWVVCFTNLGDMIKRQIPFFQFRVKISCLTSSWVWLKPHFLQVTSAVAIVSK